VWALLSISADLARRHDVAGTGPALRRELDMAEFVLTFRNRATHVPTEAEGAAWMEWFQQIGPQLANPGSRVGAVSSLGAAPTDSVVTGYTIVRADDLEAAVLLAKGCPGLAHGGGVEVGALVDM
jgi:hypothetical protein